LGLVVGPSNNKRIFTANENANKLISFKLLRPFLVQNQRIFQKTRSILSDPLLHLVQFSATETRRKGCPQGACRRERRPLEQPFRMFCNHLSSLFSYVEQPYKQPFEH
jgi:hypothetical protein